jgi:hypothetical protein
MNTDDVVIWFTVGEDPRSPSLSAVRGDYITPTAERSVAPIGPVKSAARRGVIGQGRKYEISMKV